MHTHRPAGRPNTDLSGEREQAQPIAVEHVIIRHATPPFSAFGDEETSVSRRPGATHAGGVGH
jgi:hypothetical protein